MFFYGYDAFGRKVYREEAYWNKEEGDAPGKSEYAPGHNKETSNNGKGNAYGVGKNNGNGNNGEKNNPLKLRTDTTRYLYDGMRNVTELTDRHGDSIEQYRYDAFGGLYTGITAPYNTNGFAGKSYDPKANLIDNHARWYQA